MPITKSQLEEGKWTNATKSSGRTGPLTFSFSLKASETAQGRTLVAILKTLRHKPYLQGWEHATWNWSREPLQKRFPIAAFTQKNISQPLAASDSITSRFKFEQLTREYRRLFGIKSNEDIRSWRKSRKLFGMKSNEYIRPWRKNRKLCQRKQFQFSICGNAAAGGSINQGNKQRAWRSISLLCRVAWVW